MSDLRREDLRKVVPGDPMITDFHGRPFDSIRLLTDADLAALGYVRVWQDCPNSLCVDGFTTVERNGNTEILTCLDCDGSGKVLADLRALGYVRLVRTFQRGSLT